MKYWQQPWNVHVGCSKVSSACENCYAERLHTQRHQAFLAGKQVPECYARPFDEVRFLTKRLEIPLRRRKPTVFFVNNMSDLFREAIPDEQIDQVFAVMALCPQHTFLVCTKRPERMREYLSAKGSAYWGDRLAKAYSMFESDIERQGAMWSSVFNAVHIVAGWPLPQVWLGTTVWDQLSANRAIPHLLATPAAHRWVSYEPALGPVDFYDVFADENGDMTNPASGLDWIVAGGESGPGARPAHPDWFRSVRDQCDAAGVPFMLKQIDGKNRLLDGREHNDMPFRGES